MHSRSTQQPKRTQRNRAVSHYDVYKQNKTGELLLRRKNSSEFIRTRIGCDDAE